MSPPEAMFGLVVLSSGIWFVARPIASAIARRIAGEVRRPADELTPAAVSDLQDEMANLRHEVAELAERVDFTERLLARQQESPRLERPR